MLRIFAAASAVVLLASSAGAQSAQAGSHNPALKNGAPHTIGAPAKGANSFTENQARGRFAKGGYTHISKIMKADGLWQGTAMRGSKRVTVLLDYKGNITTR